MGLNFQSKKDTIKFVISDKNDIGMIAKLSCLIVLYLWQ